MIVCRQVKKGDFVQVELTTDFVLGVDILSLILIFENKGSVRPLGDHIHVVIIGKSLYLKVVLKVT